LITRDCFDYVALGHVHRHQILCQQPLVVYPGSIERVDFSEEKEEKGFVLVELEQGKVQMEFCPLPVRSFRTIELDLSEEDEPQTALLEAIASELVEDAVVRLIYQLRPEQIDLLDDSLIREALSSAHNYTIHPELISQLSRPRLPELGIGTTIEPLQALQAYLQNREDLRDLQEPILEAAQRLLTDEMAWSGSIGLTIDLDDAPLVEPAETQLRLL